MGEYLQAAYDFPKVMLAAASQGSLWVYVVTVVFSVLIATIICDPWR